MGLSGNIGTTMDQLDLLTAPLDLRLDNTSTANMIYIGQTVIGSLTSAPVWQIKRVDQTSGIVILWAGTGIFDQIWDNRTSLSYS